MILEKDGERFAYNGTDWIIGSRIVVVNGDFRGLNGTLLFISDGDDKDTENIGPEFHCKLQPPALPSDVADFEQRMSRLYGKFKKVEDIGLDWVVLTAESLQPVEKNGPKIKLYTVYEDWAANDMPGTSQYLFTDFCLAKACLNDLIYREMQEGCLADWKDDPDLIVEADETSYECYVDGIHAEKHYEASILPMDVDLSEDAFKAIGEAYIAKLNGEKQPVSGEKGGTQ